MKIIKLLKVLEKQPSMNKVKLIFSNFFKGNTIIVIFDKYLSQTQIDINLEHFANL